MKLYILRYEILNKESKQDLELETKIKRILKSTKKLLNQQIPNNVNPEYEFAGEPIYDTNERFIMYRLKKAGELQVAKVEKKSGDRKKKKVPNDDLAKFVIYYQENLIFFQYLGHFGLNQFRDTIIKMINKTLKEEEIEEEYVFNIKTLNCQPVSWKIEDLELILREIKIAKKISLNLKVVDREKNPLKILRRESYSLSDKEGIVLNEELIKNIISNKNHYLIKNNIEDISFECEDSEGHPFTINRDERILNFDIKDTQDNEILIEKVKNAYDEYLRLYNR